MKVPASSKYRRQGVQPGKRSLEVTTLGENHSRFRASPLVESLYQRKLYVTKGLEVERRWKALHAIPSPEKSIESHLGCYQGWQEISDKRLGPK